MTAQHLTETRLVDGIPAQRLLQGLARIYRWILVTDADRRVLWMSDALSNLFGAEDLALGDDSLSFIPRLPRPEQVFPIQSNLRRRSALSSIPLELRTKDGELVPVEANVFRVETNRKDAPLLVALARPREAGAAHDGGLDAAIIDCAPDAIVAVDAEGYVLHANPAAARLLARRADELIDRPAALIFGEGAPQIERIANALDRSAEPTRCEISVTRDDNTRARISVIASAFRATKGAGEGGHALFLRDVTHGSETEAELRRANGELEHCIHALAHDLRSPLVALLGFSRLLRQDYEAQLDDTGRHFLDRIEQSGRTMESLIHDLLELSRIGQPGDRPSMVDPRAVLLQLQAELKPRLEAGNIRLVLPETPPPLVYCDRTRLYQVLSNLIGNAIEHMGEGEDQHVEVAVTEYEGGHDIAVRDNGCGIAQEDHERIFEVFQSIGRKEGRRGTGIGLAIVKKIVDTHGGRVWVESSRGEGSTFHVRLPRR
ncbi:MAG TPA: PAS domain-containing sensor histidine kinase [Myxococcota bacterium]